MQTPQLFYESADELRDPIRGGIERKVASSACEEVPHDLSNRQYVSLQCEVTRVD